MKSSNKKVVGLSKTLFIFLFGVLLLSSCSIFKDTRKVVDKEEKIEEIKVDSVVREEVKDSIKEVEKETDTEEVIVETEETTKKTTKGGSTKVDIGKGDLNPHGETIITDSLGRKIIVLLDSLSDKITILVEAQEVVEETTKKETRIEKRDDSKEKSKEQETVQKKEAIVQREEKKVDKKKTTEKESQSKPLTVIAMFIGIALLIVGVGYGIKKFILKR